MSLVLDGSVGVTFPSGAVGNSALMSGTAQASTSGTSIDFTGIPSWVKRVTVMFNGISTNGSSPLLVQIGSGSIQTTGYASGGTSNGALTTSTAGLLVTQNINAGLNTYGTYTLTTLGSNIWTFAGVGYEATSYPCYGAGGVTVTGTLDRVRITTVNGTDTFDAGSINILYE